MPLPMYQENDKVSRSKIGHILGIASGKGGVGKSTVAVNIALALKKLGHSVGLMDADVYGPSVRRMMPEDRGPSQKGEMLFPALSRGVRLITMAYFRRESEATVVRAPIANGIVTQFIHKVQWGDLDFLLIDFPPGTGDIQLTLSQQANLTGVIMVSTPQELAIMDVRKAMHMFHQVQVPILGVVENMCGYYPEGGGEIQYLFGKGGAERLARESGVPFLGEIPIDPELSRRSDCGESIFDLKREGECLAADAFEKIAKSVEAHAEAMNKYSKDCLGSFELKWKEMTEV